MAVASAGAPSEAWETELNTEVRGRPSEFGSICFEDNPVRKYTGKPQPTHGLFTENHFSIIQ